MLRQIESALLYVFVVMASAFLLCIDHPRDTTPLKQSEQLPPNFSRFRSDRAPVFTTDTIFRNKV